MKHPTQFSIGEISTVLGIKPYVIRYWEREVSLLSPQKSVYGRREYSIRDLNLLFRLRHLIYQKKYTLEGAKQQLWEELTAPKIDAKVAIAEIRTDLLSLLAHLKK